MIWSTITFKPDSTLYRGISNTILESPDILHIGGFVSRVFEPVSAATVRAGRGQGGIALGLHPGPQTKFAIK